MQTASSCIWTRITVSISDDDNRYTASECIYVYIKKGYGTQSAGAVEYTDCISEEV